MPAAKHQGKPSPASAIPEAGKPMTLTERIVYVKTWSVTYRRFIEWLPDWITPNLVTFFRCLLIVPVILALRTGHFWTALAIFAFATVLDSVDGAIAHIKNMSTLSGAFWDPVADKIAICGAIFGLPDRPEWLTWIGYCTAFIAVTITAVRIVKIARLRAQGCADSEILEAVAARSAGKLKMVIDVLAVSLILIGAGAGSSAVTVLGGIMLGIAVTQAARSLFGQLAG